MSHANPTSKSENTAAATHFTQIGRHSILDGSWIPGHAQTLVIFMIRTPGNPFKLPSRALAITTTLIVAIGMPLPLSGLASALGFVALSPVYFLYVAAAVAVSPLSVEAGKRILLLRA